MFSIASVLEVQGEKIAKKIKNLPFKIADDTNFLPNAAARSRNMRILQEAHNIALKPNAAGIAKIKAWVAAHPDLPEFTNYLAVAYETMKMKKESEDVIITAQERYPDYLFAQTNAASTAVERGNLSLAAKLIVEGKGIQYLYPERTQFIDTELYSYLDSACRYLNTIDAIEEMEEMILMYYALLKKGSNQRKKIEAIYNKYVPAIMQHRFAKMSARAKESKQLRRIEATLLVWGVSDGEAPVFNHPEIHWLYENGYDIDTEKLDRLLALPRKTLIADLSAVMHDSMQQYNYWSEALEYTEASHTFLEHAFVLLATLKSPASLEILLTILNSDDDFIEYWLADWAEDWSVYAVQHLGADGLPLIADFLHRPNIASSAKEMLLFALSHLSDTHPELMEKATAIVSDTLTYMLENPDDDSRVDAPTVTACVSYFMDIQDATKLPLIKRAFEHNLIDEFMIGDFETVEKEIYERAYPKHLQPFRTIEDYYASKIPIIETPIPSTKSNPNPNSIFKPVAQAVSSKIGRNDPCTCGSGKKYKKCCG